MNEGRKSNGRRVAPPAMIGAVLLAGLAAREAHADPPHGNGKWIHDTNELEYINFSLKTARPMPDSPCSGEVVIDRGQLRFKDKGGFRCGGMDVLNTVFEEDPSSAGAMLADVRAKDQVPRLHESFEAFMPDEAIGVHPGDPTSGKRGNQIMLYITDVRLSPREAVVPPGADEKKGAVMRLPQWEYKARWYWNGKAADLCPGWAIAVPGSWSEKGDYTEHTDHFTLACLPEGGMNGGVMAKCASWGYPPWSGAGPTSGGTVLKGKSLLPNDLADTEEEAGRFHEACTRMLRGDYCGNGIAGTVSNTPVVFYDIMSWPVENNKLKPVVHHGDDGDFYVEAAWAADGDKAAHFHGNAVCLSKRRWSTIEPNGECSTLPDPRTDKKHVVKPCEEYTVDELVKKGALFVNYSTFTDVALHRFTNPKTGRTLTTTAVNPNTGQALDPKNKSSGYRLDTGAFPGLDVEAWVWDRDEGPILSARAPKGAVTDLGAVELFRFIYEGGSFVTATSAAVPAGYKDKVLEGYVLPGKVGATAHPVVLRAAKDSDKKDVHETVVVRQPGAGSKDKSMGYIVPIEDIAMEMSRHLRARHK